MDTNLDCVRGWSGARARTCACACACLRLFARPPSSLASSIRAVLPRFVKADLRYAQAAVAPLSCEVQLEEPPTAKQQLARKRRGAIKSEGATRSSRRRTDTGEEHGRATDCSGGQETGDSAGTSTGLGASESAAALMSSEATLGYECCGISGCILKARHPGDCVVPMEPGALEHGRRSGLRMTARERA